MICSASLTRESYYYPLGNTSPVSLTQDLPPEQNAEILLLGCGDARNVLFTCFADAARKIDVTCCDIEPMIHARNVLLYTLLIDDQKNVNFENIWNIYYHWKLDSKSLNLLETQTQKLLQSSETIDMWHSSFYGSSIRFCDERSLTIVKSCWMGFQLQGLSPLEEERRLNQLQTTIDSVRAFREKVRKLQKEAYDTSELMPWSLIRAASPLRFEAFEDLAEVTRQWWECGTMPSSRASTEKPTKLNPTILYLLYPTRRLHFSIQPLLGIPVCTAYTPISKGSPFHLECEQASSTQYLVDCAKSHFQQWASAFRTAVANESVIRIFSGDALAFCFTLRNCQITHSRSMNLPCDNWTTKLLELYSGDYGGSKNTAPVTFDIVDTSNLVDVLGPLNVIPIATTLLKYHTSSSLYTETLTQLDRNLVCRMKNFFGEDIDVHLMSLMLGIVEPDLFTNATNNFEEDPIIGGVTQITEWTEAPSFQRSRLRWKRLQEPQESANLPFIHVEAKALTKFLSFVYAEMFKREDLAKMKEMCLLTQPMPRNPFDPFSIDSGPVYTKEEFMKVMHTNYNCGSFASLLSILKMTIDTDWNRCVKDIHESIFPAQRPNLNYAEEMLLNMRLFGVYFSPSQETTSADMEDAILASKLPLGEDRPNQLCVSVRISREQLTVFSRREEIGFPAFACVFENKDSDEKIRPWECAFSTVRIAFGTWHEKTTESDSHPYIEEDRSQLSGSSDMFVSVMVPTDMLLWSKIAVPWVKCRLIPTLDSAEFFFDDLGKDLSFAHYQMTSENVFITRYMPGMPELPVIALSNVLQDERTSPVITLQLTDNGLKIDSVIRHVTFDLEKTKSKLDTRPVREKIKFKSPLIATIIMQSEECELKFPFPMSASKSKVERKSSYIEVQTRLFDPFQDDGASFLFPASITKVSDTAVPILWTSSRINLDVMPPLDLKDKHMVPWLIKGHVSLMFSNRERKSKADKSPVRLYSSTVGPDSWSEIVRRFELKDGFFSIFMHYAGIDCQRAEIFGLHKINGGLQTLIFPSCLRLDLVNHTVVLDAAIIPLTSTIKSDPRATKVIQKLANHKFFCQLKVSEAESRAWKTMMPALVERCRTWTHTQNCDYIQAGEVPLPRSLKEDNISPICSCGTGKFTSNSYLETPKEKLSDLSYIISQYATRAAISPIFAVPYVEDCSILCLLSKIQNLNVDNFPEFSKKLKYFSMSRVVFNKEKSCVNPSFEAGAIDNISRQMSSNCSITQGVSRSETSQPNARGRGANQNRQQNRRRNRKRN